MALTFKQKLFVRHYILEKGNATAAARAAGYSEDSSDVEATRLLGNARVKAEIEKLIGPIFDKYDVSAERVLREPALVAFARMDGYMRIEGRNAMLDLSECDSEKSAAIVELTSDTIDQGDELPSILRTKIKPWKARGTKASCYVSEAADGEARAHR